MEKCLVKLDHLKVMKIFHYHVEYSFTYMEMTLSQMRNKRNIYGHFSADPTVLVVCEGR